MRDRGKYELFIYHSCFYRLVSGMGAARLYPGVPLVGLYVFLQLFITPCEGGGEETMPSPARGLAKYCNLIN